MSDVTRILSAIDQGDSHAADQLLPLVHGELRQPAAQRLAKEKPVHTLEATALISDWLTSTRPNKWNNRGDFFAAAAEAMRRILVESARRNRRLKHGAGLTMPEVAAALNIPLATAGRRWTFAKSWSYAWQSPIRPDANVQFLSFECNQFREISHFTIWELYDVGGERVNSNDYRLPDVAVGVNRYIALDPSYDDGSFLGYFRVLAGFYVDLTDNFADHTEFVNGIVTRSFGEPSGLTSVNNTPQVAIMLGDAPARGYPETCQTPGVCRSGST